MSGPLFFVGDDVRHRGERTVMRVLSISDGMAACEWHDGQTLHRRVFRIDELTRVHWIGHAEDRTATDGVYFGWDWDLGAPPIVPRGTFTDGDDT